jgi:queuine tRNA-ribosyltransferase
MKMTHRWLNRCINHLEKLPLKYGYDQTFFPIVQGSTIKIYVNNQQNYCKFKPRKCYSGLSVGEPEEMYAMTGVVTAIFLRINQDI